MVIPFNTKKHRNNAIDLIDDKFDFIVSRATAPLIDLLTWKKGKINSQDKNEKKNGMLLLKGGDLTEEFAACKNKFSFKSEIIQLRDYFEEEYFETKSLVYIFWNLFIF